MLNGIFSSEVQEVSRRYDWVFLLWITFHGPKMLFSKFRVFKGENVNRENSFSFLMSINAKFFFNSEWINWNSSDKVLSSLLYTGVYRLKLILFYFYLAVFFLRRLRYSILKFICNFLNNLHCSLNLWCIWLFLPFVTQEYPPKPAISWLHDHSWKSCCNLEVSACFLLSVIFTSVSFHFLLKLSLISC